MFPTQRTNSSGGQWDTTACACVCVLCHNSKRACVRVTPQDKQTLLRNVGIREGREGRSSSLRWLSGLWAVFPVAHIGSSIGRGTGLRQTRSLQGPGWTRSRSAAVRPVRLGSALPEGPSGSQMDEKTAQGHPGPSFQIRQPN